MSFFCEKDSMLSFGMMGTLPQSVEGHFFSECFQKKGCKSIEVPVCVESVTNIENSYHVLGKIRCDY